MSQEVAQPELKDQSQQLMDGPLKHIRAAALAAALVPLASVFATSASAQTPCGSAGVICGTVYTDTNGNGTIDAGDTPIAGQEVDIYTLQNGQLVLVFQAFTDSSGNYITPFLDMSLTYTVTVLIPSGDQPSPIGPDNVGSSKGSPYSSATGVLASGFSYSFGFTPSGYPNPGTGTPGYWKNHPEAWPVPTITVGGVTYTKAQAIDWLGRVGKDKTTTMFASLVSAMLNVMIGNDPTCVSAAITAGNAWLQAPPNGYGPVGSNVAGSSYAWSVGQPIQQTLDAYDNGLLCVQHRN
jgi:hypothetical protein